MLKRILIIATVLSVSVLTACNALPSVTENIDHNASELSWNDASDSSNSSNSPNSPEYSESSNSPDILESVEPDRSGSVATSNLDLIQAGPAQPGDTIVTLHTNMGDISIRLFPEEAPMAYENFVTHALNGYYDGTIFHRIIENFMIQGGDPDGTGMGGDSIWGHGFGPEFSPYLRHFRGALAMAQSALPNSIGSQFYIVQNNWLDDHFRVEFELLRNYQDEMLGIDHLGQEIFVRDVFPLDMIEAYIRYGGTPHLDLAISETGHTVFGQVVVGMDVVDAIAALEVDGMSRPTANDVVIESVTVVGTDITIE